MKKMLLPLMAVFISASVYTACTKFKYSDDFPPGAPPPIGDYTSSDEVAAASLVAKWSFDGNLTEAKQNLNGTATNTSFTDGIKSQALQGSENGYVVYDNAGPALSSLKSFTVSFWIKIDTAFCCGATQVFQIENTADFWSNMTVYFETPGPDDSLRFRMQFHKEGVAYNNTFLEQKMGQQSNILGKWTQVVATYDGATSTFRSYLNSGKAGEIKPQAGPSGPDLGELNFVNPGRLIFGTWKQKIGATGDPWMQNFKGALDEFRIYNKALTDLEISALYQLEKQGR